MRGRIAALAALAGVLAVPAGASAEKMVSYSVTIEGDAVFDSEYQTSDGSRDSHAKWSWRTEIPIVVFEGDKVHTQSAENASGTITSAFLESAESTTVAKSGFYHCTPVGFSHVDSGRFIEDEDPIPTPDPQLHLRVFGGALLDFDWCPAWAMTGFGLLPSMENGVQTYDTWFSIPREAIGMGRIIQLVHEDATGKRCPDNYSGLADCKLSFDATVTFDKIGESGEEPPPAQEPPVLTPDDIPMPPPADPGPGPQKPQPTVIDADGVTVTPVGPELPASAAKAQVTVTCPAACEGTVTATPLGRRGGAGKKVLARKAFKMTASGTQPVTVRFSKAAKRRIRDAGGVALKVQTTFGGKRDERVVTLKVKGSGTPTKGGPRPLSSGKGGG